MLNEKQKAVAAALQLPGWEAAATAIIANLRGAETSTSYMQWSDGELASLFRQLGKLELSKHQAVAAFRKRMGIP